MNGRRCMCGASLVDRRKDCEWCTDACRLDFEEARPRRFWASVGSMRVRGTLSTFRGRRAAQSASNETFLAPRDKDCAYGCCKAGDVGLYSEAIPAAGLLA